MMFFLGLFVGSIVGALLIAMFAAGKPEIDRMEAFDEGVAYGLNLDKEQGYILATNKDEIMVQYKDGMIKRFREVKETDDATS